MGNTMVGDGPVGLGLYRMANGDTAVLNLGFNDGSVHVNIVAPSGFVIDANTSAVDPGRIGPGHAIIVDETRTY